MTPTVCIIVTIIIIIIIIHLGVISGTMRCQGSAFLPLKWRCRTVADKVAVLKWILYSTLHMTQDKCEILSFM